LGQKGKTDGSLSELSFYERPWVSYRLKLFFLALQARRKMAESKVGQEGGRKERE
jgi:hypothetical protein